MRFTSKHLARSSATRPWTTVGIWLGILVVSIALTATLLGGALTTGSDLTDNPESVQAQTLIDEIRGEPQTTEIIVVTSDTLTVADPAYQAYVAEISEAVTGLGPDVVLHIGSYLTEEGPVSESGRTALLPVTLEGVGDDASADDVVVVQDVLASIPASGDLAAKLTGGATLGYEFSHIAEEDLQTGETIGLGVAFLVLIMVFGAVVAGLVPIVLGMFSIAVALGGAALVGQVMDLSFFVTNMITMIGLAVGIDYSLFIVSRYREERSNGNEKIEAIAIAGDTASRAVFFSGLTVVLALLGLVLLPNTLFRSLGIGAILVVVVAVAASLTLLPAVLSLAGDRIEWLKIRGRSTRSQARQGQFWDRITNAVMKRPVISLIGSAGLLIVLSLSYFSINTGFAGISTLPDDIEAKQAFEVLEDEFSGGLASPVEIVIDGADSPSFEASLQTLQTALAVDPDFGANPTGFEVSADGRIAILSMPLAGDINSDVSIDAVRTLRDTTIPAMFDGSDVTVLVGGETANTVDFLNQTSSWTPIVFLVVLGLSFVLLTVAFRSVVIPIKAIIMNLLSVGAAYGMVVTFFQVGVGPEWVKSIASAFGFSQVEAIEAWLPLFLFSVLFGLSMDYHVFLLSRIRESFDRTGDNAASVAYGLRSTAALITGAAAIMVAVFGGFAAGRLVSFQQMGFGLAVAVLLDATIVRSILVPASMKLLGDRNWYLPSWLEWLPNVSVEGPHTPVEPELPTPEPLVPVNV